MAVSVLIAPVPGKERSSARSIRADVGWWCRGGGTVAFLVVLVIAVVVVVLVMRAAAAPGRPGGGLRAPRSTGGPRPWKPARPTRPLAPDDDPEFLRELDRRTRRDDGSPA
jgi:hypothetical protein